MNSADPFDLDRFVTAQEGVFERALEELARGRKASHWMWFVFPQIEGLGHSPTARHYAIRSLAEARAHLAHPVLGPRLVRAVQVANAAPAASARALFGSPDDLKFQSSLTLFRAAAEDSAPFQRGLDRWFGGEPDPATLSRLSSAP